MDAMQGETTPSEPKTRVERTSDREVTVTRTFDAPAHLVFEAWSTPELFQRWWVPRSMGMTLTACEMDVRTGGRYRLGFEGMDFFGRYLEVTPPTRIAYEHGGEMGEPAHFDGVITLQTEGERTKVTITLIFPSAEARDATLKFGAVDGGHQTLARLDAYARSRKS